MMKEEILSGNKLIAEIDGAKYWPKSKSLIVKYSDAYELTNGAAFGLAGLKYHSSWNWQIPVWSKIIGLSRIQSREEVGLRHHLLIDKYEEAVANNDPLAGFKILVEFITWYNQNK